MTVSSVAASITRTVFPYSFATHTVPFAATDAGADGLEALNTPMAMTTTTAAATMPTKATGRMLVVKRLLQALGGRYSPVNY